MTTTEFYKIIEEETHSYILAKQQAYVAAGLPRYEVFYNGDSNEFVVDFCSWVIARRTK